MNPSLTTIPRDKSAYKYCKDITLRWSDNDNYGHANNVIYYSWFDTLINSYLIETGCLDIRESKVIGICAESSCKFLKSVSFPSTVNCGLLVAKIGNSSVVYNVSIYSSDNNLLAFGYFVHVFVDSVSRKPVPLTINSPKFYIFPPKCNYLSLENATARGKCVDYLPNLHYIKFRIHLKSSQN